MFIAAQQRNTNEVPEPLKWEVALPPPSLTIPTTSAVKFATKAGVVESLVSFTEKHPSNNDAIFMDRGLTTVIIDASVLIRKQRPKNSHGSFEGYAMFLKDLIEDEISKFDLVDMVFDRYFEFSTKSVTRTKRSDNQGTRYRVVGTTPLPVNWTTFLKSVENKRELNQFLAKRIVETVLVGAAAGKLFITTCNENVLGVPNGVLMWTLCSPVTRTKLIHVCFCMHLLSSHRSTRVTITSNDSDIVILGTTLFPELDLDS